MEEINSQLRGHQEQLTDWAYYNTINQLHHWLDIFSLEFKLEISQPTLAIERLRMTTLAQYRRGRSGLGTRFSISLNARHLVDQPFYRILRWSLHELLHQWQEQHGKLSKPPYHNRQFQKKAVECGLPTNAKGQDLGHTAVFSSIVRKYDTSIDIPITELSDADGATHVVGNSKLNKWSCECTNVRCAVVLDATCNKCHTKFSLAK